MGTGIRRLLLILAVASCGGTGSEPGSSARIDFVDGALEPILTRGDHFVIEGFGFGTTRGAGTVQFSGVGGGMVTATIADSEWTDFTITTAVPDQATTGNSTLSIITATGRRLTAPIHVLPIATFDPATLAWNPRAVFPRAPAGIALAAAEFADGSGIHTTLYAAGGAEPFSSGGELQMAPDSGVYIARAQPGGAIDAWTRARDTSDANRSRVLPVRRAFAAAVVGTRHNSRLSTSALYVIGGIDAAGRAQPTVLGASITADSVSQSFTSLEPLPTPLAGAIAVVRHGRIYVMGGTDALGRPQQAVYVGRIGADGHIDGWFTQPPLPGPRAYGGGIVRNGRVTAIGGTSDSVPPGGGFSSGTVRLVTGDTAAVSLVSGFFTAPWGIGPPLLPEGRSQFALLDLGSTVLVVGGIYADAPMNAAETLISTVTGDSVGPFTTSASASPIADQTCLTQLVGVLVGPSGATWHDADGSPHGLVVGGIDLVTKVRRNCAWGF